MTAMEHDINLPPLPPGLSDVQQRMVESCIVAAVRADRARRKRPPIPEWPLIGGAVLVAALGFIVLAAILL